MARDQFRKGPVKVGVRKTAKAGSKFTMPSAPRERSEEGKEEDVRRAARKGQSGKKSRPLPSQIVAVKGLDEEKKAAAKRKAHRLRRMSTREGA